MLAAPVDGAEVIGAGVGVVAVHRIRGHARSFDAVVPEGAGVAVIADLAVGNILAAAQRLTRIVGTDVAVITVYRIPGVADPVLALVAHGACVPVRT